MLSALSRGLRAPASAKAAFAPLASSSTAASATSSSSSSSLSASASGSSSFSTAATASSSPYALNALRPAPGSTKRAKRVGRGPGSGKGKTCGRGHKGQKSRAGRGIPIGFEGGQTPLIKRLPKRGFSNAKFKRPMELLNLGTLQELLDKGLLVPGEGCEEAMSSASSADGCAAHAAGAGATVRPGAAVTAAAERVDGVRNVLTMRHLALQGAVGKVTHGVKVLGEGAEHFRGVPLRDDVTGELLEPRAYAPLHLEVSQASESAIAAMEAAGSSIATVHYNRLALRALLKPEKFDVLPRRAKPSPKLMPYYTDDAKRGEFSEVVQARKLLARGAQAE